MNIENTMGQRETNELWPSLPYEAWSETRHTLHLWTQIVGKVRLALSPQLNHWWQVPLYITSRGMTTSPIPYRRASFEVVFDFIDHNLIILTSDGTIKSLPLLPRSVAEFYHEFMLSLQSLGIQVTINTRPNEVKNPIAFDQDQIHASYDPMYVNRFWHILLQVDQNFQVFRTHFTGKCSPVHFFWGSFDLAVTRFSGRRAPEKEGADRITREAYSHEVISCGFWPGDETFKVPAFYSYTLPAPAGLAKAALQPDFAFFNPEMGEFFLKYDDMRSADSPEEVLQKFLQTTYEAGANLAHWDRDLLER
jgi:hypothetical protein